MEEEGHIPTIQDFIKNYVDEHLPIAFANEIVHGVDSKGLILGKEYYFKDKK